MDKTDKTHAPDAMVPTVERDGITVLDIHRYPPFMVLVVGSAWQKLSSSKYRESFDLGITDWRVLAFLNVEPGITANRICEVVRLDKAGVSRSLKMLEERGFLEYEAQANDPRKRTWRLSNAGQEIHGRIMTSALESLSQMVDGVSSDELETFNKVMHRFLDNLDGM